MEVAYSQKRKRLSCRLAEDYLLDSDASVRVVSLDIEYGKKGLRKATLSVWRTRVVHTSGKTPDGHQIRAPASDSRWADAGFTLQALQTPPRGQKWRASDAGQLKSWEVVYDDLLDTIPLQEAPSSEYRPPWHDQFIRMSPVQLRQRPVQTGSPNCWRPQDQHESSDEEPDPDTPSRQRSPPQRLSRTQATTGSSSSSRNFRRGAQSGQYCTQKCLLGLVKGGPLDTSCLNARDHRENRH